MSRHHRRHGLKGARWERLRRHVLDRDGWRCQQCGKAGMLEVHHVRALKDGGAARDADNLTTSCRGCHIQAHRPPVGPRARAWRALVDALT